MAVQSPWGAVLIYAVLCLVAKALDETLNDEAVGSDVVHAVIAKLDASALFDSDHRLLRRLAFVETADGSVNYDLCVDDGGIWALEESKFNLVLSAPELEDLRIKTEQMFGFEWARVARGDLCKPFYAGLAARLYLAYIEFATDEIPLAGNFGAQADFWIAYYNAGGNVTLFIEQVALLENKEGCKVNADIFFVLDGSGSINSGNFDHVRQFEYGFVSELTISPKDNQVGTIIFSDVGDVIFYLNTYVNKSDLLNHIDVLPYPDGSTNTPDGLCKLVRYGFAEGNGARPSSGAVYRVAIVMTDGQSNADSSECGWDTLQAAEALHQLTPPILVYAIGVTDSINVAELEAIATSPKYVTFLDSFDRDILEEAQESHTDEVCKRATLPGNTDEEINGTLNQNESVRYHFPIPVAGITVRVCISVGRVVVYGSFSVPNPNSAFYDWSLELHFGLNSLQKEICNSTFIDPSKIPPYVEPPTTNPDNIKPSVTTRAQAPSQSETSFNTVPEPSVVPDDGKLTDHTLYISVLGKQDENNFILNGTVGDTLPDDTPDIVTSSIVTVVSTIVTSTPTQEATTSVPESDNNSNDEFILVVTSGAGLFVLILSCLLLCCVVFCCCAIQNKTKNKRTNQYNLLPRDSGGAGEE